MPPRVSNPFFITSRQKVPCPRLDFCNICARICVVDSKPWNDRHERLLRSRRYVTVLFSDVSGSSELAERLEEEEFAELLEQFRRLARVVIPRHSGNIARLQGDGLLALFGHLTAREDDGRRAVEAALELHEAVRQLPIGQGRDGRSLQLHSGIHGGLILLDEGDIERGRFDVFGEVANSAFNLCCLAASGEVRVSAETLGPHKHFFKISSESHAPIKGRSRRLHVLNIDGHETVERRIDAAFIRGVAPFVGRDQAVAELLNAARRVRLGQRATIAIAGEPGIGKTRLLDEFQRALDGVDFRVLRGYCESYLGAEPLQPFLQVIRAGLGWRTGTSIERNEAAIGAALSSLVDGSTDALVSTARTLLGGLADGPENRRAAARAATIVELIGVLTRRQALVLILDDWQWADDASRQALETLRKQEFPMLLVLAARSGDDEAYLPEDALRIDLPPLALADAEAAIARWLPGEAPFTVQEIHRQSGGSPLFIEELCHAQAAGGRWQRDPRQAGVAWINALVASRLERLPEPQADCIRVASVAGNAFPSWLLERLTEPADLATLTATLSRTDFIVPTAEPGLLRFKHGLTRDAVYATVDPVRRRALHLRVAQLLEAEVRDRDAYEWLESLSYHYDAARISEQAAKFAEAAGDKALNAMALDRARAQYIASLRSLDTLPELSKELKARWCSIAQRLGQTCVFDPLDESHDFVLFERAAHLARELDDDNALARAEYWLGYVNYGKGKPSLAVRHSEAALKHALVCGDLKLVAQVQATLGEALASAGRYREAMPLLKQAIDSKQKQHRKGGGIAIGSAYALARMAYTLGDLGRFDEAAAHFEEAIGLIGQTLHPVGASIHELICAVHLWQGRWADAYHEGVTGASIALRCRSRYLHAMGRSLSACAAWALHGDAAELQTLRECTRWIESHGGAVSTSLNYAWLVEASAVLGLDRDVRHHAAGLLMRLRRQDRHGAAMGCRALARLAAKNGDQARALRYLHLADQAAEFRESPRERAENALARSEVALDAARDDEARTCLAQAISGFESMGMRWHLGHAQALSGRLSAG